MKRIRMQQLIVICLILTITWLAPAEAVPNQFAMLNEACNVLLNDPLNVIAKKTVFDLANSATNDDIRCRSMTIATVGTILSDDVDAYRRCLTHLQAAFSRNPISNLASPANISKDCSSCGGSGRGYRPCGNCMGNGKCNACKGSGRVKRYRFDGPDYLAKCPTCEGNGRCKSCGGQGKVDAQCQSCGGSGRVLSKDKARTVYLQIAKESSDFCYRQMHPEIAKIENAIETAKVQPDLNTGISGLRAVITLYPQADNIDSAREVLALLEDKQRVAQDAERIRKAREQEAMERLLTQQRQILKEVRESSDLANAIASVQKFIKDYPTSPYISEAKLLLRELNTKSELVNSTGL